MKRKRLSDEVKKAYTTRGDVKEKKTYDGDFSKVISTGSTLLDLAISGNRIRGGGVPGGILVEAFGPSGSGKTVLLCEMAGDVQRKNGAIMFHDPEARLNKQFARMFDLDPDTIDYSTPDTVPQVFQSVRDWEADGELDGVFTDSLAALSTSMEMDNEEGDKMGMRRAKEFSEQLRKTCRVLTQRNQLMICSNQVRVNQDAGPYGQKYKSPGGEAVGFYASLRLRFGNAKKLKKEQTHKGKKLKRVIGIDVEVEVFKSSVDKPYRTAPITIIFDYGIDDIRQNLQFIKTYTKSTTYTMEGVSIGRSIEEAIEYVENEQVEKQLKEETIDLWEEIEGKFESNRKKKKR